MKNIKAIIVLFALVSFVSCQQSKTDDASQGQAHVHASKSYTLFTENLELFSEIDAFEVEFTGF